MTLCSVVFTDGQFVGLDEPGDFEQFSKHLKATAEVGKLAKMQAWNLVESLAISPWKEPPGGGDPLMFRFSRLAAETLIRVRERKGDAAARQLAEIYSSLPTPWRH